MALGRVTSLQPIEESKNGSAVNRRRVRIVESVQVKSEGRAARQTKGATKSDVSEYDSEDEESSSPEESESDYQASSSHPRSHLSSE
mmetsp:Transcript_18148/g.24269  ORF Transcript_18148/g.24269 Transcript_18148/m.24269 type:complete len:87 (+) Transcript_18148:1105-1365(+)|eukprot:CAMPEP_0185621858 /NCGR_PEP_ID=MMETSP0436-20130131/58757_1 /TAXON_ID=626734 ORGANISM="Favella taraikaensis, Strain Fe Narragansett Bay" /NCGR_SAMPLE_ID=MMETSP0436 /ASSEMBLY_ACC=CAM_ASM_000390 /LENGTH=86 /DNA_ID=CAMNT_0028263481 /DNA_START=96 /DNA_END=356 /DNA_ORIENTATION=+